MNEHKPYSLLLLGKLESSTKSVLSDTSQRTCG